MINPKKELFKWGPIDGRPIYIDAFIETFLNYPNHTGVFWPDCCCYFKKDKVTVFIEYSILRDSGEKLFRKYILSEKEIKKAYDEWYEIVGDLKKIESLVNKGINSKEIFNLFKKWNKIYLDFWLTGFLPEIANWGGERLLKRKILKFDKKNFIEIFEGLSAPEELSFFQKEEKEFLKIKLIKDKLEQLKALEKHQEKYYWIKNSYGFTEVLNINYFKNELDKVSVKKAKEKIEDIECYVEKTKERKKS